MLGWQRPTAGGNLSSDQGGKISLTTGGEEPKREVGTVLTDQEAGEDTTGTELCKRRNCNKNIGKTENSASAPSLIKTLESDVKQARKN